MAEASIGDIHNRTTGLSGEITRIVRSVGTFVLVMALFLVLWQIVKAVFHLDSLTLPSSVDIVGALFQPLQEGKPILLQILLGKTLFTLQEAVVGFAIGASLGFILAVIFAHSRLIERGLMPYVVASQTVPILAIAPMVVVWLGPTAGQLQAPWLSVAVISAYLTFFPVTINSLRGLVSVPPAALELMQSYAASRRQILFKLRIPHALPYIFTALKISATASVVGAIIGELPSGMQDGLGGAIIYFVQYYGAGPARLWATNLMAALAGILAFVVVSVVERSLVHWSPAEDKS